MAPDHQPPEEATAPLRVLALEPYYGGSHRAFIDGWIAHSRHQFKLLTLPPHHWKWRMRHAPISMATAIEELDRKPWDVLWASDMLDLAQLRGLSATAAGLPAVLYLHENQLTYPVRQPKERDLHFGFTNLTSALAAGAVWFNSAFHRRDFLTAAHRLVRQMPDFQPREAVAAVAEKATVQAPGVEFPAAISSCRSGPLHIVWAARWEHDKGPDVLFEALGQLHRENLSFRLSVLGESFRQVPEVFAQARQVLASHLEHWGFAANRDDYLAKLAAADVFVSSARHEFFGISAVEAMAAGCRPLLPNRLAYPELLREVPAAAQQQLLYDGSSTELAERLRSLVQRPELARGDSSKFAAATLRRGLERYAWSRRAPQLDRALAKLTTLRTSP